jgi:guanylate kinase
MNKLFVVSGASGSGKTTIMRSLMSNEIVSFTTRQMRQGEVDGRDYIFITKEDFEQRLNNEGLIEHTYYGGNSYGITKEEFEKKIALGDAFFIADFNGMKQIKNYYPNCTTIFIYCEKDSIEKNMRSRGDSEDQIQKRLSTYESEIENMHYYDYVVTNEYGDIDKAIEDIREIITGGIECSV